MFAALETFLVNILCKLKQQKEKQIDEQFSATLPPTHKNRKIALTSQKAYIFLCPYNISYLFTQIITLLFSWRRVSAQGERIHPEMHVRFTGGCPKFGAGVIFYITC